MAGSKVNFWSCWLILLIVLVATPFISLIVDSLSYAIKLAPFRGELLVESIVSSFVLILGTLTLSLILGVGSAYFVSFYKIPKIIEILLILPLAFPAYILSYIYADFFGYLGTFQLFLQSIGVETYFDFLSPISLVVILSLAFYPYIYLFAKTCFAAQSQISIDAARSFGYNQVQIFFKVILPLNYPAIFLSSMLIIMEVLNEYGAATFYGVTTFSTAIFQAWFGFEDLSTAIYLSFLALFIIIFILIVEDFFRKRLDFQFNADHSPLVLMKLTPKVKLIASIFLFIPIFFGFVFPMFELLKSALFSLSLFNWEYWQLVANSFFVSIILALIISVMCLLACYSLRVLKQDKYRVGLKLITVGYGFPGAVIAMGLVIALASFDRVLISLNLNFYLLGSFFALGFGYFVRFLNLGISPLESSFSKLSDSFSMASKGFGYNNWQILAKVDFPIIKNSFFVALILLFVEIVKELPITLILRPFNYETLATSAYYYAGNSQWDKVYVYAISLVAVCLIPVILSLKATQAIKFKN